jgi:sulfotransferase famil protein
MIICHNKKFIFIHVPKAAGSSIKNYLKGFLRFDDVNCQLDGADINVKAAQLGGAPAYLRYMRAEHGIHKHVTAKEIREKMGVDYFNQFFSFAFVRNPYARAYSAYRFTLLWDAKLRPESKRYQEIKDMNFEAWLSSSYVVEHKMLQTKPQARWLPKPNLVSFIGKTEKFDESMYEILHRITGNAKKTAELVERWSGVKNNQSAGLDEWKNMSGEAVDQIYKLYNRDFELFNYSREIT